MSIHQSIAPQDDSYVISSWLMYMIVGLIFLGLIGIAVSGWVIWNMSVQMENFAEFNEVTIERRKAFDEMLTKRARVQKWTYDKTCEYVKSQGRDCLDNPEFWADPKKYPKLTEDITKQAGSGLLPPENQ